MATPTNAPVDALHEPGFKARIAASKFRNTPGFGEVTKGHILLQAHGAEVWFRNIKIRPLTVP